MRDLLRAALAATGIRLLFGAFVVGFALGAVVGAWIAGGGGLRELANVAQWAAVFLVVAVIIAIWPGDGDGSHRHE